MNGSEATIERGCAQRRSLIRLCCYLCSMLALLVAPAGAAPNSDAPPPPDHKLAAATAVAPAQPADNAAKVVKSPANSYGIPQVEFINDSIQKGWDDHHLVCSPPATDGQWCRRVYLDVLGRIPTVEELEQFLADKSADKKLHLVNRLLESDTTKLGSANYTNDYAENWAAIWSNLLIGRAATNKRAVANSPVSRDGMAQYLRRSFEANKPYDKMVLELISATGSGKPPDKDNPNDSAASYNPAVNFLIGKMEDSGVQATAKTAQIFLGLSVQCTQCHNHPFNDWKQNQFWELNAFFRQTKVIFQRGAKKKTVQRAELTNVDFRGEANNHPQSAELFYEQRNGIEKIAYPVFVDGQEISRSGMLRDIDRRTELARLVVKSPYLSRAIVNRMWAHFLGYGFTKPVDDMGPHNPPSNPELLARLAADFAAGNSASADSGAYDLKQLIRWIVLSEPYALSSRVNGRNRADDPSLGEKPQFSHFYLRQMRAEELYNSLLVANNSKGTLSDEQQAAKEKWLEQFVVAFGTDDGGEASTFNGSIPQTLMMFNGDLIKQATTPEHGNMLDYVMGQFGNAPAEQINFLYMAALARHPSAREIGFAKVMFQSRNGDAAGALQDIWWAVLNSNEFILNH